MIKKLGIEDNSLLLKYVKQEQELNLFIIGDIENNGYDKEFQEIWGEFDENSDLKGVLLRYYDFFIVYSRENYDTQGFLSIMLQNNFKIISGEETILEKLEKEYRFSKKKDTYFCKLDRIPNIHIEDEQVDIRKIDLSMLDEIVSLYSIIDEFENNINKDMFKKEIEDGISRGYGIFDDNKLVAMGRTTAENSSSAMIVGVCTHPDYRNKGYASKCMVKLCKELINEGKSLCLFYDNPKAGKIYKRIGFQDIGIWTMANR